MMPFSPKTSSNFSSTGTFSIEAVLNQAAALLPRDPLAAAHLIEPLLKKNPQDPRLGLILGSAKRRLGDFEGAFAILSALARTYPNAAMTQYELGLVFSELGREEEAISALKASVRLKPDLAEAYQALGQIFFLKGDNIAADAAFTQQICASVTDPQLKPAADAIGHKDFAKAKAFLRQYLNVHHNHSQALTLLAEIFLKERDYIHASILLAQVLQQFPEQDGIRCLYAKALFHQQKAIEAMEHLNLLLKKEPENLVYLNLTAACLTFLSEYDKAQKIYETLVHRLEHQPKIWLNYGHCLRSLGQRDKAIESYRRCITLDPNMGEAYLALADLKIAVLGDAEGAAMQKALASQDLTSQDLDLDNRMVLYFALGRFFEDRGRYQEAFHHYQEGSKIRRSQVTYDRNLITARVKRMQEIFTKPFFEARSQFGLSDPAPIFILGLPRSGSTLIEQILSSHSKVEGTAELPYIDLLALKLGSPDRHLAAPYYPELLETLSDKTLEHLGSDYLAKVLEHRKLNRPYFTDKMPNNFWHIGFIHLILPNAKIIDARRHPLATCFSNFKQHFAQGQSFSYSFEDLGQYYRDYVELMNHFDQVLPGKVHRLIYEDMVNDTEQEVRRLLTYCGLDFEPACLEFHKTSRVVRTISSEQVRRPIFREGLEQWRHFEPWLDTLKLSLGPALMQWRGQSFASQS